MVLNPKEHQRNEACTIYVGNLDNKVNESLLHELFTQCGPVESVFLPRDKVTGVHFQYGFVEFRNTGDAEYATKIMNMIKLYGSSIRVNRRGENQKMQNEIGVGANLFIGNLDPMVDDKLLHDTFSAFGVVLSVQILHKSEQNEDGENEFETENNNRPGRPATGFVRFDSFEAADFAIQCMNQQWLCNRQIKVEYAFKKGSTTERHGSHAERLLAKEMQARMGSSSNTTTRPNTKFASEAPVPPPMMNGMPPPGPIMFPGQAVQINGMMPPPPFAMAPPPGFIPPPWPNMTQR